MPSYWLHVLDPPDEHPRQRREIHASDDAEAIRLADEFYEATAASGGVKPDRYVLYEGDRVVHERVGMKR